MASFNSFPLEILYYVLGWTAFSSWSISFYPQVILNFSRKSVVGRNFDFVLLNLTKHSSYLIYNASLFFSPVVQRQYREKYGADEIVIYDVSGFNTSANDCTPFISAQTMRGNQKVSRIAIGIFSLAWFSVAVCVFIAIPGHSWLWLVSIFNIIQVCMTVIKYIPQALLNFRRRSTVGFSIGNISLDFFGGVANYCQMAVQSIDQNSWVNFYGNIGKTMISLVSIFFDIVFFIQHFILYRSKKTTATQPLIQPTTTPHSEGA